MNSFSAIDLASRDYVKVLEQTHSLHKWGGGGKHHGANVRTFLEELGGVTIIDYGCGRGTLAETVRPYKVVEYDPGIPNKSGLPEKADLVVCTDVMEHVETDNVDNVLEHIRYLAKLGAYFVISCSEAALMLPDGRNAHLTIWPPANWAVAIRRAGFTILRAEGDGTTLARTTSRKGFHIWVK